jgi:hypothetical protein
MSENTDTQRPWNSVKRPDPDVDLLQRSISHVEHLLERLEYGAAVLPHESRACVDAEEAQQALADGEQLHPIAMSEAAMRPDELRLAAQREAEAIRRDARNWANEHCAIAEGSARQRLDAAERDAEQIRRTARELAHAEASQLVENEFRNAVAKAVSDVDAARALAHDTLSVAVANLANALERLKQLATVLETDGAPITVALAKMRRSSDQPDDSGADALDHTDVLGDLPEEASRPLTTRFRTARS